MIKNKKFITFILAASVATGILSGCGKTKTVDSSKSGLPKVPLTIYVAGDRPKQQDEVLRNIEEKTKDILNISLTVNYIPWSDYANQVKLKSAAGENFDIFLTFFADLPGNISRKQALDITDYINKHGTDLKKNIPEDLWKSVTVDGKIYGIPSVYPMTGMGRGLLVRKDLRLKYNLPEITDIATLETYLDTIKKNEPNMIPFLGQRLDILQYDKSLIDHYYYYFGQGMAIDVTQTPYKVVNVATTDLNKWLWKESEKAMANGWFEKDILTDTDRDGKFIQGKAAAMPGDLFNITDRQNALSKNVPGAELELAIINKDGVWYGTDPCNNFGAISTTSKNPERAVMFMNWLRQSPENWNMYMLGKEGVTYIVKGDKVAVPEGTAPADRYNPNPWFAQQTNFAKFWETDPQSYIDALNFWNNLKPIPSPLATFAYTNSNVIAEDTAVAKVIAEEGNLINVGIATKDSDKQKYLEDLDKAGMPKLIEDAQKQLDAYMATQKK